MLSKENLFRLRDSLYNKAIEKGKYVSDYLIKKAETINYDVHDHPFDLACDTKDTIDTLFELYEEQNTIMASIQMVDGLLAELEKEEARQHKATH